MQHIHPYFKTAMLPILFALVCLASLFASGCAVVEDFTNNPENAAVVALAKAMATPRLEKAVSSMSDEELLAWQRRLKTASSINAEALTLVESELNRRGGYEK